MQTRSVVFNDALMGRLAHALRDTQLTAPREGTSLEGRLILQSVLGSSLNFGRCMVEVHPSQRDFVLLGLRGQPVERIEVTVENELGDTLPSFVVHREVGAPTVPVLLIISWIDDGRGQFDKLELTIPLQGCVVEHETVFRQRTPAPEPEAPSVRPVTYRQPLISLTVGVAILCLLLCLAWSYGTFHTEAVTFGIGRKIETITDRGGPAREPPPGEVATPTKVATPKETWVPLHYPHVPLTLPDRLPPGPKPKAHPPRHK